MEQKKRGIVRRAAGTVGKAWAYSLGFTNLYRTGMRLWGKGVNLAGFVQRKLNDSPANYRHETFQEAVLRLDLSEEHLIKQARAFNVRSMSWLASMILTTTWLGWLAWSGQLTLSASILCLGLLFMTGSKAITLRFRFCQIRDQELYSFTPWFSSPGRW